ncbi:MAG: ImmA/IrrE family metallo-endopeptidase [Balneolaceae bacterium]
MGNSVKELVELALITALRERKKFFGNTYLPFCLFDHVERQGLDIKFVDISSFEGMYSKEPGPLILLSSQRPHGRQYFNCAHEYGHHLFDHGMKVDELVKSKNTNKFDSKEFLVDTFAGFLLMPKTTVQQAFQKRSQTITSAKPIEYFKIASNLGVGYQTLLFHLYKSLRLLNKVEFEKRKKKTVKFIKKELLAQDFPGEVIFVDENWVGRPVDIQIDDVLVVEGEHKISGDLIEKIAVINERIIYKGSEVGIEKLIVENAGPIFLRVSRNKYIGFNKYKHLEE